MTEGETKERRYRFESDDDGHNYLLPDNLWSLWNELAPNEDNDVWEDPRWDQIERCRIDGIESYTFTDPRDEA